MQVNQILNGVNMIHIEDEFFLKKKFNFEKLKEFGFSFENNTYVYTEYFLDSNFKAIIEISDVLKVKLLIIIVMKNIYHYALGPLMDSMFVKFVKHTNPY